MIFEQIFQLLKRAQFSHQNDQIYLYTYRPPNSQLEQWSQGQKVHYGAQLTLKIKK